MDYLKKVRLPRMEILPGVSAVGFGIYLSDINALVVADLHLGYEQALMEQGIYLPAYQLKEIKKLFRIMIESVGPGRVIILGDVKHEFGGVLRQEWREAIELLTFLKELGVAVEIVRGNHDNFLIPILRRLGVPLHDPHLREGRYLFIHGHKLPSLEAYTEDTKVILMGHEHPAVVVRDDLGIKIKFKCYLVGKMDSKDLIVLPAMSPLMPGTEINTEDHRRLLSPILAGADLGGFRVYVTDIESGIYDFGLLSLLRTLL